MAEPERVYTLGDFAFLGLLLSIPVGMVTVGVSVASGQWVWAILTVPVMVTLVVVVGLIAQVGARSVIVVRVATAAGLLIGAAAGVGLVWFGVTSFRSWTTCDPEVFRCVIVGGALQGEESTESVGSQQFGNLLLSMVAIVPGIMILFFSVRSAVRFTRTLAVEPGQTSASGPRRTTRRVRSIRGPDQGGSTSRLPHLGRRPFRRAQSDLGGEVWPLPGRLTAAAAVADQARTQEAVDPDRHGPRHGLAMAWRARLLVAAGRPEQARDLADRAVRQLLRFSDQPERIQAALVVACRVHAASAQATGHHDQAHTAEERAANILAALVDGDATYADDLGSG